jgi:hypothetical protein
MKPSITKNWPLFTAGILALLGVIVFRAFLNWDAIGLTVKLTDLSNLLAPLVFAAAVIERAVEIIVSPWRDAEASKLEKEMAAIDARPADPAANAQNALDRKAVSDKLDDYRGDTQRYAFAISLTLSILASIAGVRALGSFMDPRRLTNAAFTHGAQYLFFLGLDVALTAALLSGGADGIHSVVNAVTSFFDATADKSKP